MDISHAPNDRKKDENVNSVTNLPSMYIYREMLCHTFCNEPVVRPCGASEHGAGGQFFYRMLWDTTRTGILVYHPCESGDALSMSYSV